MSSCTIRSTSTISRPNGRVGATTKKKRLQLDTKETLELFIEKAKKARNIFISLVNHAVGFTSPLEVTRNSENEEWHTHPLLESLLPTFRMFIQDYDNIAIYVVTKNGDLERPEFLDLPDMPAHWHETVEQAYTSLVTLLTSEEPNLTHTGKPITRWTVLETFIFGESLHATQRKTLKQWKQEPELYSNLLLTYTIIIKLMLEQIMVIAEVSENALHHLTANSEGKQPSPQEQQS